MSDNVRAIEGVAGLRREEYDGGTVDTTHLVVPLGIEGATADEAAANAQKAGQAIARVADALPFVRWVTSSAEGAYALLANTATALASLDDRTRAQVVASSPVVSDLLKLLRLWVVELPDGRLAVAPGPGRYPVPGGGRRSARRADGGDFDRLEQQTEDATRAARSDASRTSTAATDAETAGVETVVSPDGTRRRSP